MATDTVAHGQTGAIPLIDLEAHGSDNVSLGQALHEAATSLGFMYLVNTGLQRKLFSVSGMSSPNSVAHLVLTRNQFQPRACSTLRKTSS